MDLSLDESQDILATTFNEFFANECPTSLVREVEKTGFSASLWGQFSELGAPGMGLPEALGGIDASMLELGLVAASVGRAIAPLPFVEVAAASRAVASFLEGDPLLEAIASGEERISLGLVEVGTGASGSVVVPAGNVVGHVLCRVGDELVLLSGPERRSTGTIENLGSTAMARWRTDDSADAGADSRRVLARGPEASLCFERARSEWKLLTAFALVGLAQEALSIGASYARERIQFGVPIGGFQGIAHPLADCATRVDGAELLAWEAAWAKTEEPERFDELASMAFIFASQTAQRTTAVSLHTHGGYGFSVEYDIQLFYRRACAWSLMGGGARDELIHLADHRFGGESEAASSGAVASGSGGV